MQFHFLLDLSLALERVLTGGAGSGVLSRFELRLLEGVALWVSLLSTWSFWDPFVEPFWCRELPLVKPFEIAVVNRLAIGGVSPARVFFDEGSGERRGGVWLCFRFLEYLLSCTEKSSSTVSSSQLSSHTLTSVWSSSLASHSATIEHNRDITTV